MPYIFLHHFLSCHAVAIDYAVHPFIQLVYTFYTDLTNSAWIAGLREIFIIVYCAEEYS